jgi:hypothetical protein
MGGVQSSTTTVALHVRMRYTDSSDFVSRMEFRNTATKEDLAKELIGLCKHLRVCVFDLGNVPGKFVYEVALEIAVTGQLPTEAELDKRDPAKCARDASDADVYLRPLREGETPGTGYTAGILGLPILKISIHAEDPCDIPPYYVHAVLASVREVSDAYEIRFAEVLLYYRHILHDLTLDHHLRFMRTMNAPVFRRLQARAKVAMESSGVNDPYFLAKLDRWRNAYKKWIDYSPDAHSEYDTVDILHVRIHGDDRSHLQQDGFREMLPLHVHVPARLPDEINELASHICAMRSIRRIEYVKLRYYRIPSSPPPEDVYAHHIQQRLIQAVKLIDNTVHGDVLLVGEMQFEFLGIPDEMARRIAACVAYFCRTMNVKFMNIKNVDHPYNRHENEAALVKYVDDMCVTTRDQIETFFQPDSVSLISQEDSFMAHMLAVHSLELRYVRKQQRQLQQDSTPRE